MNTDIEPPPTWGCFQDRITAYLETHPELDVDDAVEALIWGQENEDEH